MRAWPARWLHLPRVHRVCANADDSQLFLVETKLTVRTYPGSGCHSLRLGASWGGLFEPLRSWIRAILRLSSTTVKVERSRRLLEAWALSEVVRAGTPRGRAAVRRHRSCSVCSALCCRRSGPRGRSDSHSASARPPGHCVAEARARLRVLLFEVRRRGCRADGVSTDRCEQRARWTDPAAVAV